MLTIQEIMLIFAAIGILGGWAVGRLVARLGSRSSTRAVEGDHRIRALEADLRIAQRKAEEAELALELHREEFEALKREVETRAADLAGREQEIQRLQKSLSDECAKTQSLRGELVHRAEETVRAGVRAKDAETELSVVRAGSEAVLDQVQRLAAEREELTGRLHLLEMELTGRNPKVTRLPSRDPKNR